MPISLNRLTSQVLKLLANFLTVVFNKKTKRTNKHQYQFRCILECRFRKIYFCIHVETSNAIKFVKSLNQTFKLHYYPAIYEFRKCI